MVKKQDKKEFKKEDFKKAWSEVKNVLGDVYNKAGKVKDDYMESDRKAGGGLGLFR
jgi:hypothetical protein